jgi:hypothetical protein
MAGICIEERLLRSTRYWTWLGWIEIWGGQHNILQGCSGESLKIHHNNPLYCFLSYTSLNHGSVSHRMPLYVNEDFYRLFLQESGNIWNRNLQIWVCCSLNVHWRNNWSNKTPYNSCVFYYETRMTCLETTNKLWIVQCK